MFYGSNINLGKAELQNARIQNLASAPSSPVEGQIYFDTVLHQFGCYSNSTWVYLSTAGSGDVTQSSNSGGAGRMKVSSGANKVIVDYAGGVGIVYSDVNGVVAPAIAANFPTLNQSTTGSAASLTTPRAIYGNNFDGTAALSQIIASTYGGTGNGFTKFSGPATSEKTFTLPNASSTILTDNAVVTVAQGGSGVGTLTGIIKGNGTSAFSAATAGTDYTTPSSTESPTNKTFNANGTGNSITNIETADFAANVVDTDTTLAANSDTRLASQKATKAYVDANIQGAKWKVAVRAASTANGTLATAFENGDVMDGVTLATGDRILLKDQSAGAENGIYTVNASGAPTRATDADTATEIKSAVVSVQEGTVNADTAWQLITDTITLNTTALVFTNFISANVPSATTAIQGKVELADSTEAEAKSSSTLALTPAAIVNFPIKKTFTVGDGASTSLVCTHSLGTKDVVVSVRDASTDAAIMVDWTATSTSVVTLVFAAAPASNSYKVCIIG